MKRGFFVLTFAFICFLAIAISPAWGAWQYVESEGESTTNSTAYQTKVKLVSDSSGYHLIILSWEIGNTSASYFAQAIVSLNGSVTGEFGEGLGGDRNENKVYIAVFSKKENGLAKIGGSDAI